MERQVACILDKLNVKYERLMRFKWLGKQSLDFYLTDHYLAIECQGVQHFRPVDFAGRGKDWANQLFSENKKRDDRKIEKCLTHNVKVVYVVDKEEFLDKRYHFDSREPFSANVSYEILHINHFEAYLGRLMEIYALFGNE